MRWHAGKLPVLSLPRATRPANVIVIDYFLFIRHSKDGPQRPLYPPLLFSLPLICHIFWPGLFDIIIASIIGPFHHEWDGMGKRGECGTVTLSSDRPGFETLAHVAFSRTWVFVSEKQILATYAMTRPDNG